MNEFKKEKDILTGIQSAENFEQRKSEQLCDWLNVEEVSILRAEQRQVDRKKVLDRIVPTRVCPVCKRRIWIDSFWVVQDGVAICRSCFHSRRKTVEDDYIINGGFIDEVIVRLKIDGWRIRMLRTRACVGAHSFSERMGWSKSYQQQLESNKVKTISVEKAEKLISVFKSIGVNITDAI